MLIRKNILAHRYELGGSIVTQTLIDHLVETGNKCRNYRGLQQFQYIRELIGLFHDLGKAADAFQIKLDPSLRRPGYIEKSFDHTLAGAKVLYEYIELLCPPVKQREIFEMMVCIPIVSHHIGLQNMDADGWLRFKDDMNTVDAQYQMDDIRDWMKQQPIYPRLKKILKLAWVEAQSLIAQCEKNEKDAQLVGSNGESNEFPMKIQLSVIIRFLTGCLMKADSEDTAENSKQMMLGNQFTRKPLFEEMERDLQQKIDGFQKTGKQDAISRARTQMFQTSKSKGRTCHPGGVYVLNGPVGSGKNFAAMGFALSHAIAWDKKEILCVAPHMNIVSQNCCAFRNVVSNKKRDEWIIERDSLLPISEALHGKPDMIRNRMELLMTSLDSPVVYTTMYQLESACFGSKYANYTAMASLADSVIIIDELQLMELKKYELFILMMNCLISIFGCTVLICTATPPVLDRIMKYKIRYSDDSRIIKDPEKLRKIFDRVRIHNIRNVEYEVCGAVEFLIDQMKGKLPNGVLMLRTKADSEEAERYLRAAHPNIKVIRYNANGKMYTNEIIQEIKDSIDLSSSAEPFILVTTSIIESGVDVSFAVGVTMLTSLESLEQFSGRVNRSGEYGALADVYILRYSNWNKKLRFDAFYEQWLREDATESCIGSLPSTGIVASEFFSAKQYKTYYELILKSCMSHAGYLNYLHGSTNLVDEYSDWKLSSGQKEHLCQVKFKDIFDFYKPIDSETVQVLCSTKESQPYIKALENGKVFSPFTKVIMKNSIAVYPGKLAALISDQRVKCYSGIFVLDPKCMDQYGAVLS